MTDFEPQINNQKIRTEFDLFIPLSKVFFLFFNFFFFLQSFHFKMENFGDVFSCVGVSWRGGGSPGLVFSWAWGLLGRVAWVNNIWGGGLLFCLHSRIISCVCE